MKENINTEGKDKCTRNEISCILILPDFRQHSVEGLSPNQIYFNHNFDLNTVSQYLKVTGFAFSVLSKTHLCIYQIEAYETKLEPWLCY